MFPPLRRRRGLDPIADFLEQDEQGITPELPELESVRDLRGTRFSDDPIRDFLEGNTTYKPPTPRAPATPQAPAGPPQNLSDLITGQSTPPPRGALGKLKDFAMDTSLIGLPQDIAATATEQMDAPYQRERDAKALRGEELSFGDYAKAFISGGMGGWINYLREATTPVGLLMNMPGFRTQRDIARTLRPAGRIVPEGLEIPSWFKGTPDEWVSAIKNYNTAQTTAAGVKSAAAGTIPTIKEVTSVVDQPLSTGKQAWNALQRIAGGTFAADGLETALNEQSTGAEKGLGVGMALIGAATALSPRGVNVRFKDTLKGKPQVVGDVPAPQGRLGTGPRTVDGEVIDALPNADYPQLGSGPAPAGPGRQLPPNAGGPFDMPPSPTPPRGPMGAELDVLQRQFREAVIAGDMTAADELATELQRRGFPLQRLLPETASDGPMLTPPPPGSLPPDPPRYGADVRWQHPRNPAPPSAGPAAVDGPPVASQAPSAAAPLFSPEEIAFLKKQGYTDETIAKIIEAKTPKPAAPKPVDPRSIPGSGADALQAALDARTVPELPEGPGMEMARDLNARFQQPSLEQLDAPAGVRQDIVTPPDVDTLFAQLQAELDRVPNRRPPAPEPQLPPAGPAGAAADLAPNDPLAKLLGMIEEGKNLDPAKAAADLAADPNIDPLTNLTNRRGWEQAGAQPGRLYGRIDLDNFKALNDALGHEAGDRALQIVSDTLRRFARRNGDVAARLGGDEFGLNLESPGDPGAVTQLRDTIENEIAAALADAGFGEVAGRKIAASLGFGADETAADAAAMARKKERGISQPRVDAAQPAGLDSGLQDPNAQQPTARPGLDSAGDQPADASGGAIVPDSGGRDLAPAQPVQNPRKVDTLYRDYLADARTQGFTGTDAELRSIFNDRVRSAQELIEDMASIDAENDIFAIIRQNGGLDPSYFATAGKRSEEMTELVDLLNRAGMHGKNSIIRTGAGAGQQARKVNDRVQKMLADANRRFEAGQIDQTELDRIKAEASRLAGTSVGGRAGQALDDLATVFKDEYPHLGITTDWELREAIRNALIDKIEGRVPGMNLSLEDILENGLGVKKGLRWWDEAGDDSFDFDSSANAINKQMARDAIDELTPDPNNPDYVLVPMKSIGPDVELAIAQGADYSKPTLEMVAIDDLIATQPTATRAVIEAKVEAGPRPRVDELPTGSYGRPNVRAGLPIIYRAEDGRMFIGDGTHQTIADMLNGQTETQAIVYPTRIGGAGAKSDPLEAMLGSMEVVDDAPTVNASGDSAASAEAISRQDGMKARNEQFVVYDRAGNKRPLIGPEAVDYVARNGETYGIEGPDGFRVLDDRGGKRPTADPLAELVNPGQGLERLGAKNEWLTDPNALQRADKGDLEAFAGAAQDRFLELPPQLQKLTEDVLAEISLRNRRALRGDTEQFDPTAPLSDDELKSGRRMVKNEERRRNEQAPLLNAGALPEPETPEIAAHRRREMAEAYSKGAASREAKEATDAIVRRWQLSQIDPEKLAHIERLAARNNFTPGQTASFLYDEIRNAGFLPHNPSEFDELAKQGKLRALEPPARMMGGADKNGPAVDVLDTGEGQRRLPGDVGDVRNVENPTPTEDAPFALQRQVDKPAPPKQDALGELLDDGAPAKSTLDDIQTRHDVEDPKKVAALAESMKANGWQGRPVLVVSDGNTRVAWTATHRLAAAKQAGLEVSDVPTLEIDGARLQAAGYDLDDITSAGKKKRIEALRAIGEEDAAKLLEDERIGSPARANAPAGAADVEPVPDNVKEFLVRQLRYTPAEVDALGRQGALDLGNKVRMHPEGVAAGIKAYAKPRPAYRAEDPGPNLGEGSLRVESDELAKLLGIQERSTALAKTRVEPGPGATEPPKLSPQALERAKAMTGESQTAIAAAKDATPTKVTQADAAHAKSDMVQDARRRAKLLETPTPENLDEYVRLMGEAAERQAAREFKGGTSKEGKLKQHDRTGEYLASGLGGLERLFKADPQQFWFVMRTSGGALLGALAAGEDEDPLGSMLLGAAAGAAGPRIWRSLRTHAPSVAKNLKEMLPERMGGKPGGAPHGQVSPARAPRDMTKDLSAWEAYGYGQPHRTVPDVWRDISPILDDLADAEKATPSTTPRMFEFTRQMYMKEAREIVATARRQAKDQGLHRRADYLQAMMDEIDELPTALEKALSGMTLDKVTPHQVRKALSKFERALYAKLLGLALDTGIVNRTQIGLAYPHVGGKALVKGVRETRTPEGRSKTDFLNIAEPSDTPASSGPRMKPSVLSKIMRVALSPMRASDTANRKNVYLAAMYHARKQGLDAKQAHEWAMEITAQTQGTPGELGANPFHRHLGPMRMFTKYPSIWAQWFADIVSHPDPDVRRRGAGYMLGVPVAAGMAGINAMAFMFPRLMLSIPAAAAAYDLASHTPIANKITGKADHELSDDLTLGGLMRYPGKVAREAKDFSRYGFGTHPEFDRSGSPRGEHSAWSGFVSLLGFDTSERAEAQAARQDAHDFTADADRRSAMEGRRAKMDLREAIESGDMELAAEIAQRLTPQQRRDFQTRNRKSPYQLMLERVPVKDRPEFERRFKDRLGGDRGATSSQSR